MKPFTGAVRALILAIFALLFATQTADAGPAGRMRFGVGGGVSVDIPNEAALLTAVNTTYAASLVPVTLRLSAAGDFSASRTLCGAPVALKILGANPSSRQVFGPTLLCNTAANLWFENLDFYYASFPPYSAPVFLLEVQTGTTLGAQNITIVNSDFHGPSFDPYGDYTGVNAAATYVTAIRGPFTGLVGRGLYLHHLNDAFKPDARGGYIELSNSICDTLYSDCASFGIVDAITNLVVKNNFATRFVGRGTDCGNPHTDALGQIYTVDGNPPSILSQGQFVGNVVFTGAARGSPQGTFGAPNAVGTQWRELNTSYNLYVWDDPTQTSFISNTTNCSTPVMMTNANGGDKSPGYGTGLVMGNVVANRAVRAIPGLGTGEASGKAGTIQGEIPALYGDNLGEGVAGDFSTPIGNVVFNGSASNPSGAADYAANFDGPFDFTTGVDYSNRAGLTALKLKVVAAYQCKVAGVCGGLRDVYDYATGTVADYSKTRPFIGLQPYLEQARSATITTPCLKLWNGGPNQTIAPVSGVSWQASNNSACTSPTSYTTAPGVVNEGQYIRLTRAASPSYATSLYIGATFGTTLVQAPVTTASSVAFAEVDNGGVAYSATNTPASESARTKFVAAFRTKYTVTGNSKALFGQGGAGNGFTQTVSSGHPRQQFRSSGTGQATNFGAADTDWHLDVIAVDYTQLTKEEVFKWWRDGVRQATPTLNATPGSTFDPSSQLSQVVAFALNTTGTNLSNAKISFLWMDWGAAGYTIPDFSNIANLDKFLADNINLTNGSGPTGSPPKEFWYGTAAQWNAGLTNKGTAVDAGAAPLVMTKTAGTYN